MSPWPEAQRFEFDIPEPVVPRMIYCAYLKREAEGLDRIPYPGVLGQRIYDNISKDAWQQWLGHQTMLMNEYRLSPIEPKARKFLVEEMEKFLFGTGSERPEGFVDPRDGDT